MKFTLTPALKAYMQSRRKEGIIVEVASSDSSDFQVTELHVHFVTAKQAEGFIRRQNFHPFEADGVQVLLPNYHLDYAPEVIFDLRKVGPFSLVKTEGISL